MRPTKEILQSKFELGLGQRQIARSCGVGLGTVHEYLKRAGAVRIGWPLPRASRAPCAGLTRKALLLFRHRSGV